VTLIRNARGAAYVVALPASTAIATPSLAAITFIGEATIASGGTDLSGLVGSLEDGGPANRLGAFGSAITYNGVTGTYFAMPDRGPNAVAYAGGAPVDNTISFQSRVEQLAISVTPGAGPNGAGGTVTATLVGTTLLTNGSGTPFTGLSANIDPNTQSVTANPLRMDPEGVRVGLGQKIYVSDEYGPVVREFDASTGKLLREFTMPPGFTVATHGGITTSELPPNNTSGRQANRGMEGLAISPDGTKLYGIMQNPLIQDGALSAGGSRRGVDVRIVQFDIATGQAEKQYVYQLGDGTTGGSPNFNGGRELGVNELIAVNDHELLLVERDGNAGTSAAVKRIVKIDLTGATDVTNIANLPQTGLPPGVTPVGKSTFINLLDPTFGLAGAGFPEKIEGLAFGPDLADGRHLLLVTSDDDFLPNNVTHIYAFAIDGSDLPGFQAQAFVPEPTTAALFGAGLLCLGMIRRRSAG